MSNSSTLALNVHRKAAGEELDGVTNFTRRLPAAAVLTIAPTFTITFDNVEGAETSELAITNGQINIDAAESNEKLVPAGKAVLWHVTGGIAGKTYNIRVKSGNAAQPKMYVDCPLLIDP